MADPQNPKTMPEITHDRLLVMRELERLESRVQDKFLALYKDRDKLKDRLRKVEESMQRIGDFNLKVAQPIYVTILEAQITAMGKPELLDVAREMAERLVTPMVVAEVTDE